MLALVLLLTATGVGEFPTTLRMSFLPPNGPLGALGDLALPLSLFLTVVAFLLVAWREWRRPVAIGGIPYLTAAMIFLGGWGVLSLWHTHSLFHSLNALTVLLASLIFGGLTARLARDSRGFIVLLRSLIASASIVGALGIREYLEFWNLGVVEHRTFGPFANPDFLAGYLLLTLPITLAAFASVRERMAQLALGIGLALQSGCLMLTASRAGLGVLLVAFLVWLALSAVSRAAEGRWKTIGMGFLVIVVSMVLASAPTRSRVVGAPGRKVGNGTASSAIQEATASQSHSGEFRRWTWIGTYQMMTANPILGTGIGTFPIAYPHYATTAFTAPHD